MYEWLKAIRPFGPSAEFRGSASTIRTARVTFPLTPALSLGEREKPPLAFGKTQRGVCPTNLPNNRSCRRLFPLPVGEDQGEGNRVAVRYRDSVHSRNWRTSRVLRRSRRIPKTMNPENDEFTPRDDAVIGRAFRRSLLVLLVVGAVVGGISFLLEPHPTAPQTQLTQLDTPASRELPLKEIPVATFTDITKQAGVTFVHNNGAYCDKLLPEMMGGGVAFFDFDNDGAPDLLFINSTYWPGHVPDGQQPTTLALYHNDGQGHFRDVTPGSGLDVSCYGMGVAIGDYDNDGLDDVFITAVGGNHLFRNEGNGKFLEVTATAAVAGPTND